MNKHQDKDPIKQELLEILTKYYDGSFARLKREYIRTYRHIGRRKGSVGRGCDKLSIIENREIMKNLICLIGKRTETFKIRRRNYGPDRTSVRLFIY